MILRFSSKKTRNTLVRDQKLQLDLNQTKISSIQNKNSENNKKPDAQPSILSFDSELDLPKMCENLTDLTTDASPTHTAVQNILNKILFIGNTQDKKRKLKYSSEFKEQEPAKIIKTDTEYPELSTIELETLAELLNYLPTTSDNKEIH